MTEIFWKEAIFGSRGLKDIQNELNLKIPKEYIDSARRLVIVYGLWHLLIGITLGIAIGLFFNKIIWR